MVVILGTDVCLIPKGFLVKVSFEDDLVIIAFMMLTSTYLKRIKEQFIDCANLICNFLITKTMRKLFPILLDD